VRRAAFVLRGAVRVLLTFGLGAAAACSTGSAGSGSPNVTPGQCVLQSGTWYCGQPYGNFKDCGATPPETCAGLSPGAQCFYCYQSAGELFTCPADGGAPATWSTETGCRL